MTPFFEVLETPGSQNRKNIRPTQRFAACGLRSRRELEVPGMRSFSSAKASDSLRQVTGRVLSIPRVSMTPRKTRKRGHNPLILGNDPIFEGSWRLQELFFFPGEPTGTPLQFNMEAKKRRHKKFQNDVLIFGVHVNLQCRHFFFRSDYPGAQDCTSDGFEALVPLFECKTFSKRQS